MEWYSRKYYSLIRRALGAFYMTGFSTPNPAVEDKQIDWDEVNGSVRKTNPDLLSIVGFIIVAVLL